MCYFDDKPNQCCLPHDLLSVFFWSRDTEMIGAEKKLGDPLVVWFCWKRKTTSVHKNKNFLCSSTSPTLLWLCHVLLLHGFYLSNIKITLHNAVRAEWCMQLYRGHSLLRQHSEASPATFVLWSKHQTRTGRRCSTKKMYIKVFFPSHLTDFLPTLTLDQNPWCCKSCDMIGKVLNSF